MPISLNKCSNISEKPAHQETDPSSNKILTPAPNVNPLNLAPSFSLCSTFLPPFANPHPIPSEPDPPKSEPVRQMSDSFRRDLKEFALSIPELLVRKNYKVKDKYTTYMIAYIVQLLLEKADKGEF